MFLVWQGKGCLKLSSQSCSRAVDPAFPRELWLLFEREALSEAECFIQPSVFEAEEFCSVPSAISLMPVELPVLVWMSHIKELHISVSFIVIVMWRKLAGSWGMVKCVCCVQGQWSPLGHFCWAQVIARLPERLKKENSSPEKPFPNHFSLPFVPFLFLSHCCTDLCDA